MLCRGENSCVVILLVKNLAGSDSISWYLSQSSNENVALDTDLKYNTQIIFRYDYMNLKRISSIIKNLNGSWGFSNMCLTIVIILYKDFG